MGRVELYVRFARRVARERADLPQRIETAARSGDRQALADLLHDAKSMLGVLGAARLRESCAGLEKKISDGEAVATAVAEFCEALSNMLALVSCATQVLEDDRTSVAASH